jgi:soluble lytic murein transglycosylase-like protein
MNKVIMIFVSVIFFTSSLPYQVPIVLPTDSPFRYIEKAKPPLPPRRDVPIEYRDLFITVSEKANVPISILESIAFAESQFNPWAESKERKDGYKDMGIMQINEKYLVSDYYRYIGPFNPYNPYQSVLVVGLHLSYLYKQFGSWPSAILAYNAGETAVLKDRVPDSGIDYLMKVYRGE